MKANGTKEAALEAILRSFKQYYDVRIDGVAVPFVAEAEFHSHNEQYLLVRAAHIADIDSHEYVFFASEAELSVEKLGALDAAAWQAGISRVQPYNGHKNSDITLIVVAEHIAADAFNGIRRLKHYKSYRFGLYGWSSFRALAYEATTGKAATNRRGSDLQKFVSSL